jgi:catechol 2,3-dioxygenase-like lactoylglutathione lyase family enzyme
MGMMTALKGTGDVGIRAIDHLYLETRSFERTVAFWEGLGFRLVGQWGSDGHRAGRLEASDAVIVLAESDSPVQTTHFRLADADAYARWLAEQDGVAIEAPLQDTHWGTRWIRVRDPDGRTFALEETGPRA